MKVHLSDEEMIRHYLPQQPNQCFEALYNRYVGKVYQQCLSMTNDSEQAQDFTQDIFLKAFHKLDAFQQRSSFSTWLYSIAYNYCADQLRLARRIPTTDLTVHLQETRADYGDAQLHEEILQLMRIAMDRLTDDERKLLRMKYEDGMSIDAIAQLYELKPSAVKMRLKRSRERIQAICTSQLSLY
ncbi:MULTISPECIES: sigma-70 family RNA polymerase sigma factor [unclassified Spirosoma]|uniref:RNA polymerase sigma factor n=1 Tax=unclassified Spirosoma TaxID=2621999 RepID=UPI00095E232F|nr:MULTISPECIES: sigma-70 family RNA polymerase sigma factor [unclassified Spirosoma]MBN8824182.1 sigma-70 family RNA polymerase sigma factor [Spirosoma sp.]OJW78919.1 MAG: RNA polymerase subunit sigma-24 [Spirosoma sp. 48-14]